MLRPVSLLGWHSLGICKCMSIDILIDGLQLVPSVCFDSASCVMCCMYVSFGMDVKQMSLNGHIQAFERN